MQVTYEAKAFKADWHDLGAVMAGRQMPYIFDFEDKDSMLLGTATVTVTFLPRDEMNAKQLAALNEKLQTVRAENQKRENAILDQISKLQALTYESA